MDDLKKALIDCIFFYTEFIKNHPEQKIQVFGAKISIRNTKNAIKICNKIQKLRDKQRNR